MKTLITGGAGFIGRHLQRELIGRGHEVVVLDNMNEQVHGDRALAADPVEAGVLFVEGDVRAKDLLVDLVSDVDNVVHLAAETGVGQSMYEIARYIDINDRGTAVVLEAIAERKSTLRRLVLASSRAVYGEGQYNCPGCGSVVPSRLDSSGKTGWDLSCPKCGHDTIKVMPTREDARHAPTSIYAASKSQQESLVRITGESYGFSAVSLRFFNVYGAGQSLKNSYTGILSTFYMRLAAGLPLDVYEDGMMQRDFVMVQDVAEAIRMAVEADRTSLRHDAYNVATGSSVTILELANLLRVLTDSASTVTVSGKHRTGDIRHALGDTDRAFADFGFRARTHLADGLKIWLQWAESQTVIDSTDEARSALQSRGLLHS